MCRVGLALVRSLAPDAVAPLALPPIAERIGVGQLVARGVCGPRRLPCVDQTPTIDPAAARWAGAALVPHGPHLSRAEAADAVDGLRRAARASIEHVAAVTGLPPVPDAGDLLVVDRRTWLDANVTMVTAMLADAVASGQQESERDAREEAPGLRDRASARVNGAQLGGALAFLSTRVLGQFVPFGPPRLLLVAPNVVRMERLLDVDPDDFRLWVCLHEQTHRLQFAAAPWLRGQLTDELALILEAESSAPRFEWRRPTSVLDLVLTGRQRVAFDRVTAVMSLLEGYADVMMDRVGPEVVPSVAAIRRKFDGQRQHGGFAGVANKVLGLELKLAQYRVGVTFCRAVIDAVGIEGLNEVYVSAGLLPTLDEIHRPQTWLDRAHPGVVAHVTQPEPAPPHADVRLP